MNLLIVFLIFASYSAQHTCNAISASQPRVSTRQAHNAHAPFQSSDAEPLDFANALELEFERPDGRIILQGQLGVGLPGSVGESVTCDPGENDQCFQYGDYATLHHKTTENCTHFEWVSTYAKRLEDCFDLLPGAHWYGGGETFVQTWPIEGQIRGEAPMVTGDSIAGDEYGPLTENYWLVSTGAAIHGSEDTPLFISWGSVHSGKVCLVAEAKYPYHEREGVSLKYDICIDENIKEVHTKAIRQFYPHPTASPDEAMILYPFWSTWAQYKTDVNQSIVLEYAHRVISEGFLYNSHIEIDDHWETCYGEHQFDPTKFPDPRGMVDELHAMDLKVTLWVHPFVDYDCPSFATCINGNYFTKDHKGKPGMTSWWRPSNASGIIDFANPGAVTWWIARLEQLQTEFGIDSFKCDAGETYWLPYSTKINGDTNLQPNLYTTKFVEAVSRFGGMVEVRAARRNQDKPIFTRMLDKDSHWGYDNGLRSLIPTLLQFGIVGYPFVLPDMIGGNAYGEKPSGELFIRWMQANAFMPSVQFSIVPWEYSREIIQLTKDALALRAQYESVILEAVAEAVSDGSPINRPLWWIAPDDPQTYTVDDQYLLGNGILVAPILDEGALIRDIYLPAGRWESNEGVIYTGPRWIIDYPAPLNILPYFIKK